jgi:hypothetical protein
LRELQQDQHGQIFFGEFQNRFGASSERSDSSRWWLLSRFASPLADGRLWSRSRYHLSKTLRQRIDQDTGVSCTEEKVGKRQAGAERRRRGRKVERKPGKIRTRSRGKLNTEKCQHRSPRLGSRPLIRQTDGTAADTIQSVTVYVCADRRLREYGICAEGRKAFWWPRPGSVSWPAGCVEHVFLRAEAIRPSSVFARVLSRRM